MAGGSLIFYDIDQARQWIQKQIRKQDRSNVYPDFKPYIRCINKKHIIIKCPFCGVVTSWLLWSKKPKVCRCGARSNFYESYKKTV